MVTIDNYGNINNTTEQGNQGEIIFVWCERGKL